MNDNQIRTFFFPFCPLFNKKTSLPDCTTADSTALGRAFARLVISQAPGQFHLSGQKKDVCVVVDLDSRLCHYRDREVALCVPASWSKRFKQSDVLIVIFSVR